MIENFHNVNFPRAADKRAPHVTMELHDWHDTTQEWNGEVTLLESYEGKFSICLSCDACVRLWLCGCFAFLPSLLFGRALSRVSSTPVSFTSLRSAVCVSLAACFARYFFHYTQFTYRRLCEWRYDGPAQTHLNIFHVNPRQLARRITAECWWWLLSAVRNTYIQTHAHTHPNAYWRTNRNHTMSLIWFECEWCLEARTNPTPPQRCAMRIGSIAGLVTRSSSPTRELSTTEMVHVRVHTHTLTQARAFRASAWKARKLLECQSEW